MSVSASRENLGGPTEKRLQRQPCCSMRERTDPDESALSIPLHGRLQTRLRQTLLLDFGALRSGLAVVVGVDPVAAAFDWPNGKPIRAHTGPVSAGNGMYGTKSARALRGCMLVCACRPGSLIRNLAAATPAPHAHDGRFGHRPDLAEPRRLAHEQTSIPTNPQCNPAEAC